MEEWNDSGIMRKEKKFVAKGFGSKVHHLLFIVIKCVVE
jgi:hypothetical protein